MAEQKRRRPPVLGPVVLLVLCSSLYESRLEALCFVTPVCVSTFLGCDLPSCEMRM